MLQNTFCHLPSITVAREQALWTSGIHSWQSLLENTNDDGSKRSAKVTDCIKKSIEHLEDDNPGYFAAQLKNNQHWRLFPEFRQSIAYLDIETTGLDRSDIITTIAVYDGLNVFHYVQGDNLNDFKNDIQKYKLLVTYNGKCFDVPFIERYFKMQLTQAHIDLRYVLSGLGYSGGLKGCERQLGISRDDLADVDGFTAVLLWNEFKRSKNSKALETLLAYNIQDVLNLETLLVLAYNKNIALTPFGESHKLALPAGQKNPFEPDQKTLNKVLGRR